MDGFYRGIETSLLALSLGLALTVAVLSSLPSDPAGARGAETSLPTISVSPDDANG